MDWTVGPTSSPAPPRASAGPRRPASSRREPASWGPTSPHRRTTAGGPGTEGPWAFTHTDVTDEDSVAALVRAAAEFGGALDGLVNAAGVAGGGPVHMLPADGVGTASSRST